jgi:sirohydrochlorin ferrochelatase
MELLAARVARRWPAPVRAAYLDFNAPSLASAVTGLTGAVVVPALLTSAYHGRVDVPRVLAATGATVRLTPVLGPSTPDDAPDPLLLAALLGRLVALDVSYDGIALLAAGTSHAAARSTVDQVAAAVGKVLNVPCVAGYASSCAPTGAGAVASVRALGATRVIAASYFLAPGRLHDIAAASAREAGALAVAEPLGAADELVELILSKIAAA